MTLTQDLIGQLVNGLPKGFKGPMGLAVSGGGDSMALLCLAAEAGLPVRVVTVDHGLRDGSAAEAELVARTCHMLGLPHDTLTWTGWDGKGNLQAAARTARYRLIANWARAHRLDAVAVAHTADDQAETVVMRLARGAGVDGLSAMAPASEQQGLTVLRPLLGVTRAQLRSYLTQIGQDWVEDPSNDDPRYDRVRVRAAMPQLAELGLSKEALTMVARNMRDVREALETIAQQVATRIARVQGGDVVFDRAGMQNQPGEIVRRLLSHALGWVASAPYGPRGAALEDVRGLIETMGAASLHGCLVTVKKEEIRISRELAAVADARATIGNLWDGRWRVTGPETHDIHVAALGEGGLALCPDRHLTGLPARSLVSTPAVFRGEMLIAAPVAGLGEDWHAELVNGANHFIATIKSH